MTIFADIDKEPIKIKTRLGNIDVRFCSKDYAYINGYKITINGVLYKFSAYMHLHSNGEWKSYKEGEQSYEGKPYVHRIEEDGTPVWEKDATEASIIAIRELVETEFLHRIEKWNLERYTAEHKKLLGEYDDKIKLAAKLMSEHLDTLNEAEAIAQEIAITKARIPYLEKK